MDKFLSEKIMRLVKIFIIVAILFVAAKTVAIVKGYKFIGGGVAPSTTISFDGTGEVSASPDIATISFTVTNSAKTVKEAQSVVTDKINKTLSFLKGAGVSDKDIKTTNYSSYPKYEYQQAAIPCPQSYCPPGRQVLTGFEVSQSIEVTVRNIDNAGSIVEGLANAGVTDMQGPNFAIDKQDALKEQARKIAIDNAKQKAATLAADLGVRLVRIVNFSEGGTSFPIYGKAEFMSAGSAAPAPSLPTGENKITSNVSITYEIR
jgi:uncharacterized protein YggE